MPVFDDFHGGINGAAHCRFADAQPVKDVDLAFGSAAAVAAHGRDDEGLAAGCLDQRDKFPAMRSIWATPRLPKPSAIRLPRNLRRQAQPRKLGVECPVDVNRSAFGQGLFDRV